MMGVSISVQYMAVRLTRRSRSRKGVLTRLVDAEGGVAGLSFTIMKSLCWNSNIESGNLRSGRLSEWSVR